MAGSQKAHPIAGTVGAVTRVMHQASKHMWVVAMRMHSPLFRWHVARACQVSSTESVLVYCRPGQASTIKSSSLKWPPGSRSCMLALGFRPLTRDSFVGWKVGWVRAVMIKSGEGQHTTSCMLEGLVSIVSRNHAGHLCSRPGGRQRQLVCIMHCRLLQAERYQLTADVSKCYGWH